MPPPGHDIIVIGASTGGVEALTELARGLPADLPAAVFVVLHVSPQSPSFLPAILDRAGPLRAAHATNGEPIRQRRIYVATPDYHLLVDRGRARVVRGPRENRHRPAVDTLFRSAARAYGPRVVGVVLTGALDDGTAGVIAIKQRGGLAVVQDPADAFFPSMPASALEYADVDHAVPLSEMAALLARLAREPAPTEKAYPVSRELEMETNSARLDLATLMDENKPGTLSGFTCPECKGPLWEMHDGELLRFRCRVGHAYSGESILAGKSEALEAALWLALNTLEESAHLAERLAGDARERNHLKVAERFQERARDTQQRAALIRRVLLDGGADTPLDIATAELATGEQELEQTPEAVSTGRSESAPG